VFRSRDAQRVEDDFSQNIKRLLNIFVSDLTKIFSEMHWLLDVHFRVDFCRVQDENVQQILNIIRKIVLNSLRFYKNNHNSKAAFSHLMLDCLIEPVRILDFWNFTSP
jgi:hypothetical protein